MASWRTLAGVVVLAALILPSRDHWKSGSFAWHTWGRLAAAGRGSPASDLDRQYAQLRAPLAGVDVAGLLISPTVGNVEAGRIRYQLEYALAPCLLIPSADPDFVVAFGPLAPPDFDESKFEIVDQVNESLRLYRRRQR